jgi:hypothetical protein
MLLKAQGSTSHLLSSLPITPLNIYYIFLIEVIQFPDILEDSF